jgi:hypothetical protein
VKTILNVSGVRVPIPPVSIPKQSCACNFMIVIQDTDEPLSQEVTVGEDSNSTDNNASTESTNDTGKPPEPKRIKTEPHILQADNVQHRDDSSLPVS